jgi:hypothetical protein
MDNKTIIEKYEINPNQTLDVFYENGEVWCSDDGEWSVMHCGEMRVDYKGERLYTANDFIKVGLDTNDKVAEAEGNEELYWHMNPWFIVAKKDDLDNEYCITGDIVEAIWQAIELSNVSGQLYNSITKQGEING